MSAFTPSIPLSVPSLCPLPLPSKRPSSLYPTCVLPSKLSTLATGLKRNPTPQSRYQALIQLATQLPPLPVNLRTSSTRIRNCISISHLHVALTVHNRVLLRAESDAKIAAGMLALVVLGLDNLAVEDVCAVTVEEILHASGLDGTLSNSRIGGMSGIVRHLKGDVERLKRGEKGPMEIGEMANGGGAEVAVLLSGGVDSSVAMRLAMEQGLKPTAFYLKIWLEDELKHLGECPWEEDMRYAKAVCEQAGVELVDVGLQKEYWEKVVEYTMTESRKGRTPNPDVMCNSRIKFGAFLESVGTEFDSIVTGHYARKGWGEDGRGEIWCAKDVVKDQTYFLGQLKQNQVRMAEFPLGGLEKKEVRELARRFELPNMDRRESQGICFLGKLKFEEFLRYHLGEQEGRLVEFETGRVVGLHKGFWFYTVGQRRGIRLSGGPWHVVCKDVEDNVVFVSRDYNGMQKERDGFEFAESSWIAGEWPEGWGVGEERRLRVKTRHAPKFYDAFVMRTGLDTGRVKLQERDKGLASGQFAVFYERSGRCLGSGVISNGTELARAPKAILEMGAKSNRLQ